MFKNTTLPKAVTAKTPRMLPWTWPPNTKTPRARMIPAWTMASNTWAAISAAKNFQIDRGVTRRRFNMDWFRKVLMRTAMEMIELVIIPRANNPSSTLSK